MSKHEKSHGAEQWCPVDLSLHIRTYILQTCITNACTYLGVFGYAYVHTPNKSYNEISFSTHVRSYSTRDNCPNPSRCDLTRVITAEGSFNSSAYNPTYKVRSIRMYVRMYVCTYVHTYVRTYVCTYVCMYIRMYIHTYVCMYIRMYVLYAVCMYVCTYECRHRTYACMHACHSSTNRKLTICYTL